MRKIFSGMGRLPLFVRDRNSAESLDKNNRWYQLAETLPRAEKPKSAGLKKIFTLVGALTLSLLSAGAQQTYTLDEVWERTRANYPLEAQKVLIQEMGTTTANALKNAYLPQLTLSGRATYQSVVPEVTFNQTTKELDLGLPMKMEIDLQDMIDFPTVPKDQYRLLLEGTQLIWDGGQVSAARKRVAAETEQQIQQVEVKMHELRERVNSLYFGILMTDAQAELQQLLIEELGRQQAKVENAMGSGTATQNELDQVRVELLRAQQQQEQITLSRKALVETLSLYMGEELGTDFTPVEPVKPTLQLGAFARPELALINSQEGLAHAQWRQYTSKLSPTLALFSQAGYGKPGLNMFDPDWAPMFIVGVQLQWNIGELYNYNAEKKKLDRTLQLTEMQREVYKMDMSALQQQKWQEAEQYRALLESDREITDLRRQIKERAEVQVENGTLSRSDQMQRLTEYTAAKQQETLHRLQYLKALYELKYINE